MLPLAEPLLYLGQDTTRNGSPVHIHWPKLAVVRRKVLAVHLIRDMIEAAGRVRDGHAGVGAHAGHEAHIADVVSYDRANPQSGVDHPKIYTFEMRQSMGRYHFGGRSDGISFIQPALRLLGMERDLVFTRTTLLALLSSTRLGRGKDIPRQRERQGQGQGHGQQLCPCPCCYPRCRYY